ncbi:lytic transglycosylase domain-containing protein [Glycomyces buryatensis]|uniref:Murein transglycosylase n=1 Tax=Glycomyces buryatensis TaxID=2570927 RepID=A0A4S8QF71_9ACTN|nr:lytic transglycosylase domain-containing protein [Glycomyces buryatensis]THV43307.1 murein transglycosylase [Glycomyces buryatensis]
MRFADLPRRLASLPWKALKATGRGIRAGFRGLRSHVGRLAVQCAVTALALAASLGAGYYLVPTAGPAWSYGSEPEPEAEEAPLVLTPEDAPAAGLPAEPDQAPGSEPPSPSDSASTPSDVANDLDTWAGSLTTLGIPERALVAYGRAELVSSVLNPGCNLSWTTLAGIGATETNHGTTGGNRIQSDGTTLTDIIGSTYGEMGPMQFLPDTWERWGADGNGDGETDPHNIDDATVAAANYLCHDEHDMTTPADWYDAVFSYNHVDTYVQKVYDRADEYGKQSTA